MVALVAEMLVAGQQAIKTIPQPQTAHPVWSAQTSIEAATAALVVLVKLAAAGVLLATPALVVMVLQRTLMESLREAATAAVVARGLVVMLLMLITQPGVAVLVCTDKAPVVRGLSRQTTLPPLLAAKAALVAVMVPMVMEVAQVLAARMAAVAAAVLMTATARLRLAVTALCVSFGAK